MSSQSYSISHTEVERLLEVRKQSEFLIMDLIKPWLRLAYENWVEIELGDNDFVGLYGPLAVRDGFGLRLFVVFRDRRANGLLVAVPKDAEKLPVANSLSPNATPVVEHALPHFMHAVDGDQSPLSYFFAAYLAIDGADVGQGWHRCRPPGPWPLPARKQPSQARGLLSRIFSRAPKQTGPVYDESFLETKLDWFETPPKSYAPVVVCSDTGNREVVFYTVQQLDRREKMLRHSFQFTGPSYVPITDGVVIAQSKESWI